MILTIARKELKTLFASPMAWAVLTLMQFILAYFFLRRLQDYMEIQQLFAKYYQSYDSGNSRSSRAL